MGKVFSKSKTQHDKNASIPNHALVFVKPHAINDAVISFTRDFLAKASVEVLSEGRVNAEDMREHKIIDKHYAAIASAAMETSPEKLFIAKEKLADFQKNFSQEWGALVKEGKVLNADAAQKKIGLDTEAFIATIKEAEKESGFKLGPGLYVVHLAQHDLFVVNGFYLALRQKFVVDGAAIHYFMVRFDPTKLSWKDFRTRVIGSTDPAKAEVGSIRRHVLDNFKELGLQDPPNAGDNTIHGSAGPLEGLKERTVWMGVNLDDDPYGKALLGAGISRGRLEQWMANNTVETVHGVTGPIFDLTEEHDSGPVLQILVDLDLLHFKQRTNFKYQEGMSQTQL